MEIKCKKCGDATNINFQFLGTYICPKCSSVPAIKKMTNFTSSVVNYVSNGMENVSTAVKEERMSICRTCPFFNSANPKNPTCNKCGCFLEVKTGWASEKCPEGKWHEIKTASSGGCGCNKT
jgi:hypothetical protein